VVHNGGTHGPSRWHAPGSIPRPAFSGSASGSRTIYVSFSESARRSRASALAILTETKLVHARALAELGARWANLRSGPRAVSDREAHELVAPAYEWWVNAHRDNPPAIRKSGNRNNSASFGTIMTPRSTRICLAEQNRPVRIADVLHVELVI